VVKQDLLSVTIFQRQPANSSHCLLWA